MARFQRKIKVPGRDRETGYALAPRKPELEAQRITRTLKLVKPVARAPAGLARVSP
jgi:hypothetical protein